MILLAVYASPTSFLYLVQPSRGALINSVSLLVIVLNYILLPFKWLLLLFFFPIPISSASFYYSCWKAACISLIFCRHASYGFRSPEGGEEIFSKTRPGKTSWYISKSLTGLILSYKKFSVINMVTALHYSIRRKKCWSLTGLYFDIFLKFAG